MAVRDTLPDSIAFAVEVRLSTERRYRVTVRIDSQDRRITLSSGILPDIEDQIDQFLAQLTTIAANQWAYALWDGTRDRITEFQTIRIYTFYLVHYDRLLFNISLGDSVGLQPPIGHPISVDELNLNTIIQL